MAPSTSRDIIGKRIALRGHASEMGEGPFPFEQLFSSKEGGTHKESRIADFLTERFHLKEKYYVLLNTTLNLKVVLW